MIENVELKKGRPDAALLLSVHVGGGSREQHVAEFLELADSAGVQSRGLVRVRRTRPDPRYFIGSGKADEIQALVKEQDTRLLIVDQDLTSAQERSLEARTRARVLDRTGLILDIFSQRASSHEGKLQVELAQLEYLSTRLVRGWSHLERQKGGIGLRGPGEKQLETDRRLLRRRVGSIKQQLAKVSSQREHRSRRRRRNALPLAALVGYANVGKSTLFNALTGAGVETADRLFATLDPVVRRLALGRGTLLVSDTVGFVRNLPHELIEAFNATLIEVRESDLILHVEDVSDPERREHRCQVESVLASIGADDIPRIAVFNKIDRADRKPEIVHGIDGRVLAVRLSAHTGAGLEMLKQVLEQATARRRAYRLCVPPAAGDLRAFFYRNGSVLSDRYVPGAGWMLEFELADEALRSLHKQAHWQGRPLNLIPCRGNSSRAVWT